MAEYLSPGVYIEEFDSGTKPMEGVGISTIGVIGLCEKGPVGGVPQFVTNFADFKRIYGGYLSENEFGEYRFLAYAVEHFFVNGGTRAFIVRVAPADAHISEGFAPAQEGAVLQFFSKNPGLWGDDIRITVSPASKAKTQILEVLETSQGKRYIVKNGSGFSVGDVISFSDGEQKILNQVVNSRDNILTLKEDFPDTVVDKSLVPERTISSCEFSFEVRYGDQVEFYDNLTFNVHSANFVEKRLERSDLVSVRYVGEQTKEIRTPFARISGDIDATAYVVSLSGGSNGSSASVDASTFIGEDNGAGNRTGIQAFLDNSEVSLMAIPGITDPNVQLTLVAHCESLGSRFAVLDIPKEYRKIQDILTHRNIVDSSYAAMYHPWLEVFDPLDKKTITIPPSGSVLGIYARTDATRGIHKAPANEVVRACVGLACPFNKGEQDILNPKGVNLIRSFPGMGIRVWGARTTSSDASWKYINVRRLFIFIEETIKANTNWAVFEPNDEVLWVRVQRTISIFLNGLWRDGSLAGSSPEEAFFVNIGRDTMSQDDINNGRLVCVIGVAPVKPAEFIIFRISQKTGDAE